MQHATFLMEWHCAVLVSCGANGPLYIKNIARLLFISQRTRVQS